MKTNTSTPYQHLDSRGVESQMTVSATVAGAINTSTPFSPSFTHARARTRRGVPEEAGKGVEGVEVSERATYLLTLRCGPDCRVPDEIAMRRLLKALGRVYGL